MGEQCFCNNLWTLGFPRFTYTKPKAEHCCVIAIAKLIGQFFFEGEISLLYLVFQFFSANPTIFSKCLPR